MASLEKRNGIYRLVFRFNGRKHSHSLATDDQVAAIGAKAAVEQRTKLIKNNLLAEPSPDCDVAQYLIYGKSVPIACLDVKSSQEPNEFDFSQLCERFFANFLRSSIEENSFGMLETHKRHLLRIVGESTTTRNLNANLAQTYINKRATEPGIRGGRVAAVTIKKELTTLMAILRWANEAGIIDSVLKTKGLRFPKSKEKPPFQTMEQINRTIAQNNLSKFQKAEIWDCLFLSTEEISQLLSDVQKHARHPFLYPMFAFAAHTGARRSEMLRSRTEDVDMVQRRIVIREKKRLRGKTSTRQVPMSNFLHGVIAEWLKTHPGGQFLFCLTDNITQTRKLRTIGQPITKDESHNHLRTTLRGTVWENMRGWHCLRHSFCSNCAAVGVEQRIINQWVGHQTEEMVRRYRHLFPNLEKSAIESVFNRTESK